MGMISLSLTSSKGTEAYRNWWPGPGDTMVRFMNRSIELLDAIAAAEERGDVWFRGWVDGDGTKLEHLVDVMYAGEADSPPERPG